MNSSREGYLSSRESKSQNGLQIPLDDTTLRGSANSSLLSSRSFRSTNDLPDAKSPYNSLAHGVRRIIPHEIACKVGCKGIKCKYDTSNWPEDQMAVNGLYSHWITDEILAMARPRDALIKESKLIHKMKKCGIRSIFNLQTRNEHKDCGGGILKETGFSYDPNDFTSSDIYYYNFELEDFSVGSIPKMLDMVKVFDFAISEGKTAVHCHAGLGRTGLLIACYLIYSNRMNANQAIHFIREKRPGSVQMNEQIQAIKDFEAYLNPLRVVFCLSMDQNFDASSSETGISDSNQSTSNFSLHRYLHRQRHILHGVERKNFKYIPKIIFVCGEQLKKLANRWMSEGKYPRNLRDIQKISDEFDRELNLKTTPRKSKSHDDLSPNLYIAKAFATINFSKKVMREVEYYQKLLNESNDGYAEIGNQEDPFVLSAMIWSWLDHLKEPVLRDQEINILLKGYSNRSSSFDFVNWKDLDKGTLQTVYYLIEIINQLMPLEERIESDLINQLIGCLTQTKIRYNDVSEDDTENYYDENNNNMNTHVSLLNTTKNLKRNNFLILKEMFKELVKKNVKLSDKMLGKTNFKKNVSYHDYEEPTWDDTNSDYPKAKNRSKQYNFY